MSYHTSYPSWDPARNCKRLREFEDIEFSRQRCRRDFEGGKLLKILTGFRPRIWPLEECIL
jgi:hypothetical protein